MLGCLTLHPVTQQCWFRVVSGCARLWSVLETRQRSQSRAAALTGPGFEDSKHFRHRTGNRKIWRTCVCRKRHFMASLWGWEGNTVPILDKSFSVAPGGGNIHV